MLFGYPIAAVHDNWVHECLCEMLQSIHVNAQDGHAPPVWPEIIPEAHRQLFSRKTALRDLLSKYQVAFEALSRPKQDQVIQALNQQNQIPLLLSGASTCDAVSALPKRIGKTITKLFTFAFGLLTTHHVRDRHYGEILGALPYFVCPFCGYEYFDQLGAPREDLDHYLLKSKYPFAAANLRNLAPMCGKCNSGYKGSQDMLFREDGTRRRAIDPYDYNGTTVSLIDSVPFEGHKENVPQWVIEFDPDNEETDTWNHVFKIRQRYQRDVLDEYFITWLRQFSAVCKYDNRAMDSDEDVINTLAWYEGCLELMGLDNRGFIKVAMFRMLRVHCERGNRRLIDLVKNPYIVS